MSDTVVTEYNVVMFTASSETLTPEGYRMVRVGWKETEDKVRKIKVPARSAVCVYIPVLQLSPLPEVLQTTLQAAFEEMQKAAITAFINGKIAENTSVNTTSIKIPAELVTMEGIAAFDATERTNKRLSTESIKAWFDASLANVLEAAFVASNPSLSNEVLRKVVAEHKEVLSKLASPRSTMPLKLARDLIQAVELSDASLMKVTLIEKLTEFTKPKELTLSLTLGS